MLRKQFQRSLLLHVITQLSPKCPKSVGKMKKTDVFPKTRIQTILAKVLGTALKYLDFSVFSGFPFKTVHPFRNLLAVLSPSILYKVETRKILGTLVQHCLWGEGFDLCELEKAPDMQKCPKTFVYDCSYINRAGKTRE